MPTVWTLTAYPCTVATFLPNWTLGNKKKITSSRCCSRQSRLEVRRKGISSGSGSTSAWRSHPALGAPVQGRSRFSEWRPRRSKSTPGRRRWPWSWPVSGTMLERRPSRWWLVCNLESVFELYYSIGLRYVCRPRMVLKKWPKNTSWGGQLLWLSW